MPAMRMFQRVAVVVSVVVGLIALFPIGNRAAAQSLPAGPAPARQVVAEAVRRAQIEKKTVLIEFGASWCKWCTNFQNFVHSPQVGATIADNYVVANLDVLEEPEKKSLEN